MRIGSLDIGDGHPAVVVAEIGQNHNGDVTIARNLVGMAKECGADAVKFQMQTPGLCYPPEVLNRPYDSEHSFGATYREHREALELTLQEHADCKAFAEQHGLLWFCTACDKESLKKVQSLGPPCYKVASRDAHNGALLAAIAKPGKPIILSTGMSPLAETDAAVATIRKYAPVVVLQCTSAYPTHPRDVGLRMMKLYRRRYDCPVGISDHTVGVLMGPVAIALGACMVEKHITLARTMKGRDHACSLEAEGLRRVVRDVRAVEAAMADHGKPMPEAVRETMRRFGRCL